MNILRKEDFPRSILHALWFSFLLFPLMVMKVSVASGVATVSWRWGMLPLVAVAAFVLSLLWQMAHRASREREKRPAGMVGPLQSLVSSLTAKRPLVLSILLLVVAFALAYPWFFGFYQTDIMVTALIYVLLALGLNVIVGLGGLLNLGHAAFFAVGAYTYGLIWKYLGPVWTGAGLHSGWLFWISIPLAGVAAMIFGVLLSLPVLRLRGDYLAIITLAFGEIVRMVLQNWTPVTGGAQGVRLIPRPWLLDLKLRPAEATTYIYYITLLFVVLAVISVRRLENSRVGRALEGMREDEIACQSVGINLVKNKLVTFALGAFWAGIAGTLFAAKTTFINPDSFTLWESIMVLMAVVIGGTGSIPGVIVGALLLKLLPEWFRPLAQYRMIIYGVAMIVIIIFKSEGLIPRRRKLYTFTDKAGDNAQ